MQQNNDSYKTIKCTSEGFHKDRGSKFYGYAYPVKSEDELKIKIDVLKKNIIQLDITATHIGLKKIILFIE